MAEGTATLVLHSGGREVTRDELDAVEAPAATKTWFPVKHATVYETVRAALTDSGFVVARARFGLARENHRMFATLDLTSALADGVTLSVGIRNSTDKSFPLGFCAGSRVFVCDNLAFRAELAIARKHTRYGAERFQGQIVRSVKTLSAFRDHEARRVLALQQFALGDEAAEALLLRSFEGGFVSHLALPRVIREWRQPTHEEFRPRTAWSLLNAFTTVLAPRAKSNPHEYARQTMRLGSLVDATAGLQAFALPAHAPEDATPAAVA